ncbi:MAG: TnpV protein [Clostridia bacterium]|nr:TnpV protein [Clostridia bacterium]
MTDITYSRQGDYNIPNLTLPEVTQVQLGKYARMRKKYLEQYHRVIFMNLLTSCKLDEHLMEIEKIACSRMELIVKQMAQKEGITESLKASDQMLWVQKMNNIIHSAEEIVLRELIYN